MITPDYARLMAAYNKWQNDSLYTAASSLDDTARRMDRGGFFRSIHNTLCHILWGDRIWLSRFTDYPAPEGSISQSATLYEDWAQLRDQRGQADSDVKRWAATLTPSDLEGALTWFSPSQQRNVTKPKWMLITHFFNHQTHHRGQVHAMLTAAGAKPDDTDIPFMPEAYQP